MYDSMTKEFDVLRKNIEGYDVFAAGLPSYSANFTRDSLLSFFLSGNAAYLKEQLIFSARKQGSRKDSFTGEEPGKIHHEYPGGHVRGASTQYNACDTTALFLIGHEKYVRWTGDKSLCREFREHIIAAVRYIVSHIHDDIFYEDPAKADAEVFGLKVTYWKDSELYGREEGRPRYPAVFPLSHVQNMAALRSASFLLKDSGLDDRAQRMAQKLRNELFDTASGTFFLVFDREGPVRAVSSDALHALYYLEEGDLAKNQLQSIEASSGALECPLGYRTLDMDKVTEVDDDYHAGTIWPFEQAFIYLGARKHGLTRSMKVARRVFAYLDTGPEFLYFDNMVSEKAGCDPQLWTIAAKKCFALIDGSSSD